MMKKHLISIIIPIFNRENLIPDTLESIISQSYTNWECLVIDDGSTDSSFEVVSAFAKADSRVKLLKRPIKHKKGANTCRNIGIEKSMGDFVIFFDSDDLMTKDHLRLKLEAILNYNCDIVIAQTSHFNHPDSSITHKANTAKYLFDHYEINVQNYFDQKINWLTCDPIYKKKIINDVRFHLELKRGQEYFFHIQILLKKPKITTIDEVLTLRRMHENSIRAYFNSSEMESYEVFQKIAVYQSISNTNGHFKTHVKKNIVRPAISSSTPLSFQWTFFKIIIKEDAYLAIMFIMLCFLNKLGIQAYNFTSYIIKKIK